MNFKSLTSKNGMLLLVLTILTLLQPAEIFAQRKKVIIGYVGGFRGLINTDQIAAKKLTHINYAFVDIKNNRAWLHREATDTINFRRLVALKKQNSSLKILISIGGWTWSGKFSDAVLTDTARLAFAVSAADIIKKYDMDGIDIDWEYPGRPGYEGNIYRPEDKQNYTLLFRDLRRQLDTLQRQTGKKYLLTTAAGGFKNYLNNTDMGSAQQYLDYVNLMTYDYSGGKIAGHHTNLYTSGRYKSITSADGAVSEFMAAGVPASKLVMGIAFYGHVSNLVTGAKGIGDTVAISSKGKGYTAIKDSLVNQPGYKFYRDRKAKAPYLYNAQTRQFITFDDEWSVRKKSKYVIDKKLAGVMFWEYDSDLKGYLLNEINRDLR
jgi:chitinase